MFVIGAGPTYDNCSECGNREPISRMRYSKHGRVCFDCHEPIPTPSKPVANIPESDEISNNIDHDFDPKHFDVGVSIERYHDSDTTQYNEHITFEKEITHQFKDEYTIQDFLENPKLLLTDMGFIDAPDNYSRSKILMSPFSIFINFKPKFLSVRFLPEDKKDDYKQDCIRDFNDGNDPISPTDTIDMTDYFEEVDMEEEYIDIHSADPLRFFKNVDTKNEWEEDGLIITEDIKTCQFSQDKFEKEIKNKLDNASFINSEKINEFFDMIMERLNKKIELECAI